MRPSGRVGGCEPLLGTFDLTLYRVSGFADTFQATLGAIEDQLNRPSFRAGLTAPRLPALSDMIPLRITTLGYLTVSGPID